LELIIILLPKTKTHKEIKWHEEAPTGKMDLVVDLNFRMDSSALYSDIVLPSASWYEKADINTTDMHSLSIHSLRLYHQFGKQKLTGIYSRESQKLQVKLQKLSKRTCKRCSYYASRT